MASEMSLQRSALIPHYTSDSDCKFLIDALSNNVKSGERG